MICAPGFLAWTLGGPEIFLIFLVVLLLFGAKKLPELARGLGSSVKEFKKAKDEFDEELRRTNDDLRVDPAVGRLPAQSGNSSGATNPAAASKPAEPEPADSNRVS